MQFGQSRKRDILTLLGLTLVGAAAAAWPLDAIAQAPQLPEIGFLSSGSSAEFATFVGAFRQGMSEQRYVDGRDVSIIFRWADGKYDKLQTLANDLVGRKVKLIVASGGLISAQAALKATASIPILFVSGFDPVELGLVASLNRPGRNATGAWVLTTELLPKRLELLHNLGARIGTIGFLVNPKSVTAERDRKAAEEAKQQLRTFNASTEREITAAFELAAQEQVSAFVVTADPFFNTRRHQIVTLAACQGVPVIYPWREYVEAGGLMSYGTELTWGYNLVGRYAGRILGREQAKPGDLPVQLAATFKLVINLDTAKALGLNLEDVAPQLISLADETIEKGQVTACPQ